LAAELNEEFGDGVMTIAERAIAAYEADGMAERVTLRRILRAIISDIAAKRFDPYAPIALH
jgi:hypothetical protein